MADYRITDLVTLFRTGQLSRRQFVQRAAAIGLSLTAISSVLEGQASAAPVGSRRGTARHQADATTLVVTDATAGTQWLTMDPGWFFEINSAAALYLLYDQLYHIPDSTNPSDVQPLLAEALPEFSEDGLTATVKLRQGVKFHRSGNTMTANDVVFSFNRLKNIGYQGSFLGADYWTEVTAVDDATVQFTLGAPNAALASVLTALPLSVMDSARVTEFGGTDAAPAEVAEGETAPEVQANEDAKIQIDQDSVGTGPYMLVQFEKESETILERNPDFWGEAPMLEQIIWSNTTEVNAELQKVQLGDADIAYNLAADQVEAVKSDPNLQLISGPTLAIEYVAMKVTERGGPLANRDVRLAIAHAIDYDGIISGILNGAAERPAAPVPLGLTGADKVQDQRYTTDLAMAQQLWDGAGVGEAEIELIYDSDTSANGGASYETLAVKIQSDLQQISGLTVQLAPMPGVERLAKYRAGDFQMTIGPWTPDFPDVDNMARPFSQSETAAAGRVGYSDPEVDALLDQGISELDPAKREEIYVQVQQKIVEAAAFLVLFQPTAQKPASVSVQGAATHSVYQLQLRTASKTA